MQIAWNISIMLQLYSIKPTSKKLIAVLLIDLIICTEDVEIDVFTLAPCKTMGHLFMIDSAPLKFYNEQNVVQRTFPWQYDVAHKSHLGILSLVFMIPL